MDIHTELGIFRRFEDLLRYMDDEGKDSVFISSCYYYGLECLVFKNGMTFSRDEIYQMVMVAQ